VPGHQLVPSGWQTPGCRNAAGLTTSTLGAWSGSSAQQQANVAVRHPAGLQYLAVGVGAELCYWPHSCWWMGGHQGYPARAPYPREMLPFPRVILWAGSPAASSQNALRLSAPSPWPSGWAASTPPRPSFRTTWPSLRKAFTRHGLGMPARNPEAVRQRAIDAVRQRSGWRPASPSLDPGFVALNHGELPVRARSDWELAGRVQRAEDYAALGARVVVELHTESHATRPSTRAWAITHRADRAHRLVGQRASRAEHRHTEREHRRDRTNRPINLRNGDGC
jgi:hypothetical protein